MTDKALRSLVSTRREALRETMKRNLNEGLRTAGTDVFESLEAYIDVRVKLAIEDYKDSTKANPEL